MEEHQAIQTELEQYVGEFASFSEQQKAYEIAKQQAKGVSEFIETERVQTEKIRAENEAAWEKWQEEELAYKMETASYDILVEQEKVKTLETNHLEILKSYEEQPNAYKKV